MFEGAKKRLSIERLSDSLQFSAWRYSQKALDDAGVTGITVTNVLGYGMQKGHAQKYRGVPVETKLLPKVQVDIVITKIPVEKLVAAIKGALYTGSYGDGKIFIYDVENVIKVRTGEEGYDALQDEE